MPIEKAQIAIVVQAQVLNLTAQAHAASRLLRSYQYTSLVLRVCQTSNTPSFGIQLLSLRTRERVDQMDRAFVRRHAQVLSLVVICKRRHSALAVNYGAHPL